MLSIYPMTEYSLICDECGEYESIFTFDGGGRLPKNRTVHSAYDAIMCADYHISKGKHYCPICWAQKKGAENANATD